MRPAVRADQLAPSRLESFVSYMRQTTFLRYLRNFIYLLNEKTEEGQQDRRELL